MSLSPFSLWQCEKARAINPTTALNWIISRPWIADDHFCVKLSVSIFPSIFPIDPITNSQACTDRRMRISKLKPNVLITFRLFPFATVADTIGKQNDHEQIGDRSIMHHLDVNVVTVVLWFTCELIQRSIHSASRSLLPITPITLLRTKCHFNSDWNEWFTVLVLVECGRRRRRHTTTNNKWHVVRSS